MKEYWRHLIYQHSPRKTWKINESQSRGRDCSNTQITMSVIIFFLLYTQYWRILEIHYKCILSVTIYSSDYRIYEIQWKCSKPFYDWLKTVESGEMQWNSDVRLLLPMPSVSQMKTGREGSKQCAGEAIKILWYYRYYVEHPRTSLINTKHALVVSLRWSRLYYTVSLNITPPWDCSVRNGYNRSCVSILLCLPHSSFTNKHQHCSSLRLSC